MGFLYEPFLDLIPFSHMLKILHSSTICGCLNSFYILIILFWIFVVAVAVLRKWNYISLCAVSGPWLWEREVSFSVMYCIYLVLEAKIEAA